MALADSRQQSFIGGITKKIDGRVLVKIIVITLYLELGENRHRVFVSPIGQLHHIVAIRLNRVGVYRIDDNSAVQPGLFLHAGMGVIPVSAGLSDFEAIVEGFPWRDAFKADARHTIHLIRQDNTVPMYRRLLVQTVGDMQRHRIALTPA